MRKIFLAFAAGIIALGINAQTPDKGALMVRPMVGLSFSTMEYHMSMGGEISRDSKMKTGFTGGVELGYQANRWLQPSIGLFFQQQGSNFEFKELGVTHTSKENFNYLTIPVLANFYIIDGLALKTGIMPGFLLSAKETTSNSSFDVKDKSNSFQMQIPVGISYEFSKFVIDARVAIPVTKANKEDWEMDLSNTTIGITVGYNFNL